MPPYNEHMDVDLRFNEAKTTQAAALLLRLRGGRMHYLKLLKLLYLADRAALLRWGFPITYDRYVSMNNGPVPSRTYGLIVDEGGNEYWRRYISAPMGDYEVEAISEAPQGLLSRAEENLLADIFSLHGRKDRWSLVDETHKLPEWRHPKGSSEPIEIGAILAGGGENAEKIESVLRELRAWDRENRALDRPC